MKRYALLGSIKNTQKSLSPFIHNTWMKHYGIDGEYVIFPWDDIADTHTAQAELGRIPKLRGFNITTPYKNRYGGNTFVINRFSGDKVFDTDTYGFRMAFLQYDVEARKSRYVAILGDGFIAKKIQSYLKTIDIDCVMFSRANLEILKLSDISLPNDVFQINATSSDFEIPNGISVNYDKDTKVDDFSIQMLIHQAAATFKYWHGFLPDTTLMENALKKHLSQ